MADVQHMQTFTLSADSLLSKFGFGDGDMLHEVIWEGGYLGMPRAADEDRLSFASEVLISCVMRYLAPLLPANLEFEHIAGVHNPIRVCGWHWEDPEITLPDVSVEITEQQVLDVAAEVARGWQA